jgi:uncharacterized repeat protein (TIGR02543 family)
MKKMSKHRYGVLGVVLMFAFFASFFFLPPSKNIASASVLSSAVDIVSNGVDSIVNFFTGSSNCSPAQPLPRGSTLSIDDTAGTVNVIIPYGSVSSMCFAPEIQTFYSKAVITPSASVGQDFTNPVTYTINQDGYVKSYVVTVSVGTNSVVFDSQGAAVSANPAIKGIASPETTVGTLPTAPKQIGSTFGGWYTEIGGGGTEFTATTSVTKTITVYAKWIQNTVTFDNQGATSGVDPINKTVVWPAANVTLPTAPTKTGYVFLGWYTSMGGRGTKFTATTPVMEDITVYASWVSSGDCTGTASDRNCWSTEQVGLNWGRGAYLDLGIWRDVKAGVSTSTTLSNGKANTDILMTRESRRSEQRSESYPAAHYCATLTEGNVPAGTWYLPSYAELMAGVSSLGSVFPRTYWSSTEHSDNPKYYALDSSSGYWEGMHKDTPLSVRCLRGLPAVFIVSFEDWNVSDSKMYTVAKEIVVPPSTTVVALPTVPARTGFTFGGWVPPVGYPVFTTTTPVTADITLRPLWNRIIIPPTVTISTPTSTVVEGNTATLTWTPANTASCTADGNDSDWAGSSLSASDVPHTWTTRPLSAGTRTYSISCTGYSGDTTSASVTIIATPVSAGGGGDSGSGGGTTVPSPSAGTGIVTDPYQISTWSQLNNIRNKLTSNYKLTSNLSSSSAGYADFGNNWTPIGSSSNPFTGSLNGNNYTISDLKITASSGDYAGLFGHSKGNISNLGLTNIDISGSNSYVGAIAGQMTGGTINRSYSTGNITGSIGVGGLVGYKDGGVISNSYSKVNVNNFSSYAGGLVGRQLSGTTNYSYSTGLVKSNQTNPANYGGLIGNQEPSGVVNNSYWDMGTSKQSVSVGGIGKTTAQMKDPATFSGWVPDIWNIVSGDYPVLTNPATPTTVSFTENIIDVSAGGTATLTWNTENASSCTVKNKNDPDLVGTTLNNTNGSYVWTTPALPTGEYAYSIVCHGIGGVAQFDIGVTVGSGSVTTATDLKCSLAMTSPITSSNEVSVNNNTVWTASTTPACPSCTTKWSVTDANNPNPTSVTGTNPWNKIFTTIGSKTVSAQFVILGGSSGTICTSTIMVVQSGGGREI